MRLLWWLISGYRETGRLATNQMRQPTEHSVGYNGSMFENIRLAAIGSATVLDAVLLIALLEKPNRRRVAVWMWWMTTATLVFHVGSFVHHLLAAANTDWALQLDRLAMTAMVAALMFLPAAILHGCLRVSTTGIDLKPKFDWRFGLLYLPVLLLIPMATRIQPHRSRDFVELVADFRRPYVLYFLASTIVAAICYFRLRNRAEFKYSRKFLTWLSGCLFASGLIMVSGAWYGLERWPAATDVILLGLALVPVATVVLFIYFVLRFGLLSLLLERSLVYGAIVISFLLIHEVVFADLRDQLSNQYRINFAVLEGVAAVALILLYAPFRQRVAEGLRYLTGARVETTRVRTRDLSSKMTAMAGRPQQHIIESVGTDIKEAFEVEPVRIVLFQPESLGTDEFTEDEQASARELDERMRMRGDVYVTAWKASDPATVSLLDDLQASVSILMDHGETQGMVLTGTKESSERLSDEELNALVLLAEQLAVTLQLERLQAERIETERRAIQQEKLSTLGLLAGSIAHEVRNPLSSIKAITSVMVEDLGPESEHTEDLKLILSEIDRLSKTTSQLLAFARSEPQDATQVRPAEVLEQTLQLMRHVAKRDNIRITVDVGASGDTVSADINALREIYFNLIKNSIEAAGSGGEIAIACSRENGHIVTRVADNGPGIAPEIQDRLFEPFATTKADGTGLGLYIVGRHVRELGGEIHCETTADAGTEFTLKLPIR